MSSPTRTPETSVLPFTRVTHIKSAQSGAINMPFYHSVMNNKTHGGITT